MLYFANIVESLHFANNRKILDISINYPVKNLHKGLQNYQQQKLNKKIFIKKIIKKLKWYKAEFLAMLYRLLWLSPSLPPKLLLAINYYLCIRGVIIKQKI